ncbi:MAG TPA: hypothetical protein VNT42_03280 [Sphingomonas sp.]|nr:hypothetical protein [Sphingomonas sp.]
MNDRAGFMRAWHGVAATIGLAAISGLAGCGTDTSIEHTNAATTAELNDIAANISATAGRGPDGDQRQKMTVATRPRKY